MIINFRVEFDPTPIRHVAVRCPECFRWFRGNDITNDSLHDNVDLKYAHFVCPVCGSYFSAYDSTRPWGDEHEIDIEEVAYPDVYKDCLTRKETWE